MNVRNWVKRISIACALCSAALAGHAAPTLWVSTGSSGLATVDVATGATTAVGGTGVVLTDIAFSPTGDLYGISFSGLYSVNTSNGATSLIGGFGSISGTANALVFGADGTLYMAGTSLYSLNTLTGAASAIGSIGYQSGGDLAFIGSDLYMASSTNQLVEVDVTTGVGSLIGSLGVGSMFGLATPDNVNLYGVAGQSVYLVDTSSGAASFQSSFSPTLSGGAFGLAFLSEAGGGNDVPEPGTLALLGLALLSVSAVRKSRSHRSDGA